MLEEEFDSEIEIDSDITVCCYKNAALMVKIIESEEGEKYLIFENPASGRWYKNPANAVDEWIEMQEAEESEQWSYLIKKISEDRNLFEKVEKKEEMIEY